MNYKLIVGLFFLLFLGGALWLNKPPLNTHYVKKDLILLDSEVGGQLFEEVDDRLFKKLKEHWRPQLANYCGVCSSVIVIHAIDSHSIITQETFFSEPVEAIVPMQTVQAIGMTLRELTAALSVHGPQLSIESNYSHLAGCDLFFDVLERVNEGKVYHIVNFSRDSLKGKGEGKGHFSIIAGFHKTAQKVLILEVLDDRHYWVDVRDLYDAMMATDYDSKIARGWVTIQGNLDA